MFIPRASDCPDTRDRLLRADELGTAGDPVAAAHLARCPACGAWLAAVVRLEQAWRDVPVPPSAVEARDRFLDRLNEHPAAAGTANRRRTSWRSPRWVAAAVLFFVLWSGGLLIHDTPKVLAGDEVIARLVDWNLALASAQTLDDRGLLYTSRHEDLRAVVATAALTPSDRELSALLLETGANLASNLDPLAAAERFNTIADRLAERAKSAAREDRQPGRNGPEARLAVRYARLQALVADRGIADNLRKAERSGALDFDHKRRLEKLILRDARRMRALIELLDKHPDVSRAEIRKALDVTPRKPTARGPGQTPNPVNVPRSTPP